MNFQREKYSFDNDFKALIELCKYYSKVLQEKIETRTDCTLLI